MTTCVKEDFRNPNPFKSGSGFTAQGSGFRQGRYEWDMFPVRSTFSDLGLSFSHEFLDIKKAIPRFLGTSPSLIPKHTRTFRNRYPSMVPHSDYMLYSDVDKL